MLKSKIVGITLILVSIIIPIYKNYQTKQNQTLNKKEVQIYLNETANNKKDSEYTITVKKVPTTKYIAVLSIPEINLKRGLVEPTSTQNSVKYNIEIIKGSSLPDKVSTNLVLAAHSGNSKVSFFKDLDKLKISSLIELYYNGFKYTYELSSINTVNKSGEVKVTRTRDKNTITLITCKKDSDTEQVIYLGYLKAQIPY